MWCATCRLKPPDDASALRGTGKGGTRIVRHPQLNQQLDDFFRPLFPESPPESPDLPADLPVARRSWPAR